MEMSDQRTARTIRPHVPRGCSSERASELVRVVTILALLGAVTVAGAHRASASLQRGSSVSPQSRRLWASRYDGKAHGNDAPIIDRVSPDGSTVFVTGASAGAGGLGDYATVAYRAATGHRVWTARYDGPANGDDAAIDLVVSPNGHTVYVTGTSTGGTTGLDFATVAYNAATGKQRWVARFDGGHGDENVDSIAVSPDGSRVIVTGQVTNGAGNGDYATVSYDAMTGAQQWVSTYDGTAHHGDVATSIVVGADGTAFITGWSFGANTAQDIVTIAYDGTTGSQLWLASYNGPGSPPADRPCFITCIKLSPDGAHVYITGVSFGLGTSNDFVTVSYATADGTQVWASRYNGPTSGWDQGNDLAVTPDGSHVVVTGQSAPKGSIVNDIATVSYDAMTGAQQWVSTYDGPSQGDDVAVAVASPPDSRAVVITGFSQGASSDYDVVTIAYGASGGNEHWAARYDGPVHGPDHGFFVAISPDGTDAFVAADSTGNTMSLDYLTLAYRMS
jgi:hypothetical protein